MTQIRLLACLVVVTLAVPPTCASASNIPGHMLSATIMYQVLRQENPLTIEKVRTVLEKHPWYANQWQARLQDASVADHGLVLFIQAARWPDDIRTRDRQHHRGPLHYVNLPFKPEGQPGAQHQATAILQHAPHLHWCRADSRVQYQMDCRAMRHVCGDDSGELRQVHS